MSIVNIKINGKDHQPEIGENILKYALDQGIHIPNLCYDSRLTPSGACRMCIVQIEGRPGVHTACTMTAAEGLSIITDNKEIRALRKSTLELILSEHKTNCTSCDREGACQLQDYAYEYGAAEDKFPSIAATGDSGNYTAEGIAIGYDVEKCIRCMRCVKICAEVQHCEALTFQGRSGEVLVTTPFNMLLTDSSCEMCGQCLDTCPTGALYEKSALGKGRVRSLKKTRTTCLYCGVGCQLDLNVHRESGKLVKVTGETGIIPNDGNTCVKGRFGFDFIHREERLTTPLIREGDAFREADWEEALELVARRFSEIKKESGSDSLAGLSSAKSGNEDNYIMQKFVRSVLGTNNVDHCARLCHASTVAGLARAFGSGAMTNSIDELENTPLIFVIGSNTTECHPVMGIKIRKAVAEGRTKLIVADPRRISLTDIAHLHMQQKPGSDVALINAMMYTILDEKLSDEKFIKERTENFEVFIEAVKNCPPEFAEKVSGVKAEDIRKAARMYASAESASIVYSMGITQHTTGTDNVLSLANLAMLTGNVGKPYSGVNPLRGQNNVQGACDMGALPNVYPGYQKVVEPEIHKKFEKGWNAKLSDKVGLTVVEIMEGARKKEVRGLYVVGENPVLSDPDSNEVFEGLKNLDFLVVQDLFLTETAELADVVLPACSFAERDGTFTNTERRVQKYRRAVNAPGISKPDWEIICSIANKMGAPWAYFDVSEIMKEIASLTPIYGGISYGRIDDVGLQWPCTGTDHPGTKVLHQGKFARGLGKFHPVNFLAQKELPDHEYPLILTTGRMLQHWHTGTMTRKSKVLDEIVPIGYLEINPADAGKLGIEKGEEVSVSSRRGRIRVGVNITEKMAEGVVFLTFHFKESPANALTIAALDPLAKIPEFKACAVKVGKLSR
ncbi:MAG: formate dehydrogenase subunit alpha [Spirochaetaceae bacterium]|nr:formate dehydrogenase subunit alpha [Spirochaetaceae bacterium]